MPRHVFFVQVILVAIALADVAAAQCHTDVECKGDRICENGICVVPQADVASGEEAEPTPASETPNVVPAVAIEPVVQQPQPQPVVSTTQEAYPPREAAPSVGVPPRNGRGSTTRIDLNLSLVSFTRTKWDFDSDEGGALSTFGFGPVTSPRIGFGIAFSPNGHAFFGARIILGVSTEKWRDAGESSNGDDEQYLKLDYTLLPYFEYAFGDGKVKPFIAVQMGLDGTYERWQYDESGGDYSSISINSTNMGMIGLGGGVHLFLAQGVSLDLWLSETIGVGSLIESDHWEYNGNSDTEDDKTFVWRSRTELFLGLSGWI